MMTDNKVNRVLDLLLMILWKQKKMPDEWQNVVKEGKDGYLKFDYTTCVPILWSALQATINEVEKLKKEVNKLKKNRSDSD